MGTLRRDRSIGENLTIFMQPDLAAIADGLAGLTNVYVTAGNGTSSTIKRNASLMEAYAETAGLKSRWTCGERARYAPNEALW